MKKIIIGLLVIVILGAGGVGAFLVTHQDKRAQPTSSQSQNTQDNTAAATIVQTKTNTTLGSYLADNLGNTLYTYGGDQQGISNCSGICLYDWPIYEATTTTSLPANVTVITRADGKQQYAYKGLPLYTFTQDAPGQIMGNNVSNFHVAKP